MIYQKLHIGDPPYLLNSRIATAFPMHKHIEIELFYCICGNYELIIDRRKYEIKQGEVAIIGSMVPHEVLEIKKYIKSHSIVVEIGPTMLREYFNAMESENFPMPIFDLKRQEYKELYELFEEVARLYENKTSFSNLLIIGNIYKISAYILKEFVSENNNSNAPKRIKSINAIEEALEYIYNYYDKKITVKDVSDISGYSKSNFCKIFKNITGDTFHNVLNDHRVKMACLLLKDSDFSVEDIATRVGFADSKSFCRIFKKKVGVSPTKYKKDK